MGEDARVRILVVDDDLIAAEVAVAILEDAGYGVALVQSGAAAMGALVDGQAYDAVVSDMNMPHCSGLDLFKALRERGAFLPFILLSGDDPAVLLQREPRLDACLAKDRYLENTLSAALGRLLAARLGQGE